MAMSYEVVDTVFFYLRAQGTLNFEKKLRDFHVSLWFGPAYFEIYEKKATTFVWPSWRHILGLESPPSNRRLL